MGIGISLDI